MGKATGLSTSAAHQRVRRLEQRGIKRYSAVVDHDAVACRSPPSSRSRRSTPPQPDDAPERLRDIEEIVACHSVAGDESYLLKVQVATPGRLEALLARIRSAAGVSTRTTVVLSTPWEGRAALPD